MATKQLHEAKSDGSTTKRLHEAKSVGSTGQDQEPWINIRDRWRRAYTERKTDKTQRLLLGVWQKSMIAAKQLTKLYPKHSDILAVFYASVITQAMRQQADPHTLCRSPSEASALWLACSAIVGDSTMDTSEKLWCILACREEVLTLA